MGRETETTKAAGGEKRIQTNGRKCTRVEALKPHQVVPEHTHPPSRQAVLAVHPDTGSVACPPAPTGSNACVFKYEYEEAWAFRPKNIRAPLSSHRLKYVCGGELLQRLPRDALHHERQHDHGEVAVAGGHAGGVPQPVREDEGDHLNRGRG